MASMTIRPLTAETLRDLLICPITQELLQDPVIDTCGHTFEKADITAWLQTSSLCPLSRREIRVIDLRPNHAIKDVLDVLAHHDPNLTALDEDEQGRLEDGINLISAQRTADAAIGIPDRLSEAERRPSLAIRVQSKIERSIRDCFRC